MIQTDVLIIGCGIAGATTALRLARNSSRHITLITREPDPHESNTRYAQGGIISCGPDDSVDTLVSDILAAGAGASSLTAAQILAEEGPSLLKEILIEGAGVAFDKGRDDEYDWGQEAAHSCRRILHVGDCTGQSIIRSLVRALQNLSNVQIVTNSTVIDLITFPHHSRNPLDAYSEITCHGAYVFNRSDQTVTHYVAAATVLATGGLGRIYRNTTNPPGSRGDGIAMAHRAGARIVNAEYVQFTQPPSLCPERKAFSSVKRSGAKEESY